MADINSLGYNPTYMIDRAPDRFGNGTQEDYLKRAKEAINHALAHLKAAAEDQKDLKQVFFEILEQFRQARKEIVIAHQTPYAELFGLRRDLDGISQITVTDLTNQYAEYGRKFLEFLQSTMQKMKHDKKTFYQTKLRKEERCLGRTSAFELEILTPDEIQEKKWLIKPSDKEIPDYAKPLVGSDQRNFTPEQRQEVLRFKKEHPELYKRYKMALLIGRIVNNYPSKKLITLPNGSCNIVIDPTNLKSLYVRCVVRLEIKGKLYALTEMMSWLYQDWASDPLDRMLMHPPKVILLHQDPSLIPDTLDEIAAIFEKVIKVPAEFDQTRLLFNYLFAHCMPDTRGDAAIREWFEQLFCAYHDLPAPKENGKMADLEALTSPLLSQFVGCYHPELLKG